MSLVAEINQAVKTNNAGSVRRLLISATPEDLNDCIPGTGHNALMVASINGHTEIVMMLLADGRVDMNKQEKYGCTALMLASKFGQTNAVKMLLADSRVEDVNMQDNQFGNTALMNASSNGHTEIVKMLLADSRVDVNIKNNCGKTALISASREGHSKIVKLLLADNRVDVKLMSENGLTALFLASQEGHTEVVKMLLADGRVDMNIQDRQNGYTALMMASTRGHTEIVKMLLADSRVDVNMKDKHGQTALKFAKKQEVQALLSSYVPPLPSPLPVVTSPPPTVVVSAPQVNTYPQAPISSTVPKSEPSWLAARLFQDGVDAQLVKECEQALVAKEGFVSESDFAEAEDVDAAYLRSIGITGKGIQNRLLKLHMELSAQHAHTIVAIVGGKKSDVIISDPSSVTALTAQMATLTAQLTALAAQVSDLQLQCQQDRQLLVAAGLMDPAGSSREG